MSSSFFKSKRFFAYLVGLVVLFAVCFLIVRLSNPQMEVATRVPISVVRPFALKDQSDSVITEEVLKGKIALAYFFFSTCTNVCPLMYEAVRSMQQPFAKEGVIALAYTCDPDTDDVPRLREYATEKQAPLGEWYFLTGAKKALYEVARFSYKIHDPTQAVDSSFNFMHTQYVAIVDDGKVVMIVDGLKQEEVKDGKAKIAALIAQKKHATPTI